MTSDARGRGEADEPILVVGGGMAGMGAAWALHQAGRRVEVLEAGPEVGGVVRSVRVPFGARGEEVLLELGPQTLSTRDPDLLATFRALGLAENLLEADPAGGRRYIVHRGRPAPLPSGPGSLASTPLLSPRARLRLLGEPFRGAPRGDARDPDESVADFVRRRLGPEVLDRFVDPFVSGVFAGDPEQLSLSAVLPELARLESEHGSLVRGVLARAVARRKGRGGASRGASRNGEGARGAGGSAADPPRRGQRPSGSILSFPEGLQAWPRAVARQVPVRVGHRVVALSPREGGGWRLQVERMDGGVEGPEAARVVLAAPAPVLSTLLSPLGAGTAAALEGVPYAPVSLVHLGWSRAAVTHPLDGFGLLAPSSEGRRFLGSLWPGSLFPSRLPDGGVLTANFVGGARTPARAHLPDEELLAVVEAELSDLLGIHGPPIFRRVTRWPQAIPQYTAGHGDRIEQVRRFEDRHPGLVLAGNWREGVSLAAAWKSGAVAAARLLQG